jgi:hypothetical protein
MQNKSHIRPIRCKYFAQTKQKTRRENRGRNEMTITINTKRLNVHAKIQQTTQNVIERGVKL